MFNLKINFNDSLRYMVHLRTYNAQLLIPQTYELFCTVKRYNETCILVLSCSYLFDNGMF